MLSYYRAAPKNGLPDALGALDFFEKRAKTTIVAI